MIVRRRYLGPPLAAMFSVALIGAFCDDPKMPTEAETACANPAAICTKATVQYSGIEGGCWMIISDDGPDGPALRRDRTVMDAHWAYELSIKDKILAAGSLRSDDGVTPNGSLLILDVETRAAAMAIINADPATKAGLRGKIVARRWNRAILAGVAAD